MKNKEIVISIAGLPGSGKSTISQIIISSLMKAGIKVVSEESPDAAPELQAIRVASISKNLKVLVKEVNIHRDAV